MSVRDWVLLALGAILGVLAQQSYVWFAERYQRLSVARRRSRVRSGTALSSLYRNTIKFYRDHGLYDSLYVPSMGANKPIPLLASNLIMPRTLSPYKENIFDLKDKKTIFPVHARLIKRAVRTGATIFDGEIIYVTGLESQGDSVERIELKSCNYFAYASLSLRLQTDLRARWRRKTTHKECLATFQTAVSEPLQPQVLGCACVSIFEDNDEHLIAIAHRSAEVFNGSGMRGVIPNFGAEPNVIGRQRSHYSLLFYNFIKEFAEEFYDLDELTEMLKARRAHPDWILHLPPVERVLHEAKSSQLILEHLGVAVNPTDGALVCAFLARFTSPLFFRKLRAELRANWESSNDGIDIPSIQFVSLFDPLIDEWADNGELGPSSVFAIDLARKRLREAG